MIKIVRPTEELMVEIRVGRVVLRVNVAVTGVLILAVKFHMNVEAREVEKEVSRTFVSTWAYLASAGVTGVST